jgi:hypothetical protein
MFKLVTLHIIALIALQLLVYHVPLGYLFGWQRTGQELHLMCEPYEQLVLDVCHLKIFASSLNPGFYFTVKTARPIQCQVDASIGHPKPMAPNQKKTQTVKFIIFTGEFFRLTLVIFIITGIYRCLLHL